MERELKFNLPDRAAYQRLAQALGPERARKEQTNYYLQPQPHDLTRSVRAMVRVRQENEDFILTLKLGHSQAHGYFEAEEVEVSIAASIAQALIDGEFSSEVLGLAPLERLRQVCGGFSLKPQGSMRNLRRTFDLLEADEAELDETSFPDGSVDYELEVETQHPDAVRNFLTPLFERLEIPLHMQTLTKYERFLARPPL